MRIIIPKTFIDNCIEEWGNIKADCGIIESFREQRGEMYVVYGNPCGDWLCCFTDTSLSQVKPYAGGRYLAPVYAEGIGPVVADIAANIESTPIIEV